MVWDSTTTSDLQNTARYVIFVLAFPISSVFLSMVFNLQVNILYPKILLSILPLSFFIRDPFLVIAQVFSPSLPNDLRTEVSSSRQTVIFTLFTNFNIVSFLTFHDSTRFFRNGLKITVQQGILSVCLVFAIAVYFNFVMIRLCVTSQRNRDIFSSVLFLLVLLRFILRYGITLLLGKFV